ncbi:MAG: DUF3540 domain-containing protein [Byssovorax sp.]
MSMSRATARRIEPSAVYQETALVERVEHGEQRCCVLRAGSIEYRAARAVSCLVAPRPGDKVLAAVEENGAAFVLAVLERAVEGETIAIEAEGDLSLRSRDGRVTVGGAAGVDLVSGGDVTVAAEEVRLRAAAATLVIDSMHLLGKAARAEIAKIAVVATSAESVIDRLTQRVKRAYRFVEEREQVRAGALDMAAEKAVTVTAENAVITTKELVKIDGGQIQLG